MPDPREKTASDTLSMWTPARIAPSRSWMEARTVRPKSVLKMRILNPANPLATNPKRTSLYTENEAPAKWTRGEEMESAKKPAGPHLFTRSSTMRANPRVTRREVLRDS